MSFEFQVASGMIAMVMRIENVRERPSMLGECRLVGLGVGRIDGGRLSRVFGMQEETVIVIETGKDGDSIGLATVVLIRHAGRARRRRET